MGAKKSVSSKTIRKYSDEGARTSKINQMVMISITLVEVLLIFALFVQSFAVKTTYGKLGIIPIIVLIVGVVVNLVIFIRNKNNPKLRYSVFISFFIGWGYLMLTGTNVVVPFYIYPLIIATILYFDRKYEKIIFSVF